MNIAESVHNKIEWKLKIPKILYLYWGRNKPLSYLRYLTAYTFNLVNPDWEIIVYFPKETSKEETWKTNEQKGGQYHGKDYFEELCKIPNLSFRTFDARDVGLSRTVSEVHKSDAARLLFLCNGGFWSDFDIVYFNSIDASIINTDAYSNAEALITKYDDFYSIGLMGGAKNNKAFRAILKEVPTKYNPLKYQSLGSSLYKEVKPETFPNTKNIELSLTEPILWNEIDLLFYNKPIPIKIGIHWFGGAVKTYILENHITEDNFHICKQFDITFIKEIRNLLCKYNVLTIGQQHDQL